MRVGWLCLFHFVLFEIVFTGVVLASLDLTKVCLPLPPEGCDYAQLDGRVLVGWLVDRGLMQARLPQTPYVAECALELLIFCLHLPGFEVTVLIYRQFH